MKTIKISDINFTIKKANDGFLLMTEYLSTSKKKSYRKLTRNQLIAWIENYVQFCKHAGFDSTGFLNLLESI